MLDGDLGVQKESRDSVNVEPLKGGTIEHNPRHFLKNLVTELFRTTWQVVNSVKKFSESVCQSRHVACHWGLDHDWEDFFSFFLFIVYTDKAEPHRIKPGHALIAPVVKTLKLTIYLFLELWLQIWFQKYSISPKWHSISNQQAQK
jgi:hypothetical protein